MCVFFSCVSNGKGKVLYFTPMDIAQIMSEGNKKSYNFNSHTSLMDFKGIKGEEEDKWNKWEYDVEKKEIKEDSLVTADDRKAVQKELESFLKDKDLIFLRNLYGANSGHWNSGDRNSGHWNSGHWNSGDRNSGNRNSGDWNSGHRNSGDRNSGHWNSGNRNSGHWNSGDWNSGHRNSGDRNSGDWNSGDWNSGFFNSDEPCARMFNKPTKLKSGAINFPGFFYNVALNEWIDFSSMTDKEKTEYPKAYVADGYLKKTPYKEAWAKAWKGASKEEKEATKKLPNFNAKIFEEITGIDIKDK